MSRTVGPPLLGTKLEMLVNFTWLHKEYEKTESRCANNCFPEVPSCWVAVRMEQIPGLVPPVHFWPWGPQRWLENLCNELSKVELHYNVKFKCYWLHTRPYTVRRAVKFFFFFWLSVTLLCVHYNAVQHQAEVVEGMLNMFYQYAEWWIKSMSNETHSWFIRQVQTM